MNSAAHYSSLSISLLAVGGGLAMLVTGGESLVSGASRLARHFGMSTLLIGLTVIAFGTSIPELFVSLTATLQGHPGIMLGNVVGSNIANIGLILGISLTFKSISVEFHHIRTEYFLGLAAGLILLVCASFGYFPRSLGVVFVLVLFLYTLHVYRRENDGDSANDEDSGPTPLNSHPGLCFPVASLLITGGFLLLSFGSNIFIRGAVDVARHFQVNELIIGLTLAAIGTSLPELAAGLAAIRRNEADLLMGNIIGSNLFNLYMVLGLTAAISPLSLARQLLYRDLPAMLGFTLILLPILGPKGRTRRPAGILLLVAYLLYCLSLAQPR